MKDPVSDSLLGRTEKLEAELAEIWKRILKVKTVNRDDKFFDLGGDSLKAMDLTVELTKRYGSRIALANLADISLGELAEELAERIGAQPWWARLLRVFARR
jgi:acyl carrier protein